MIVCVAGMCVQNVKLGVLCAAVFGLVWMYFRHMVYDKFGGRERRYGRMVSAGLRTGCDAGGGSADSGLRRIACGADTCKK